MTPSSELYALFEEFRRQPQQVVQHVADDLESDGLGQMQDHPGAQRLGGRLDHVHRAEGRGKNDQELIVEPGDGFVDHELQVRRGCQRENLEHHRQHECLDERAVPADEAAPKIAQLGARPQLLRLEIARGRDLESNPGEMLRYLRERQTPHAQRGIVNDDPASVHRLERHEMVQVPVQDARQRQLPQVLQFQAQGPAPEVERACHHDEVVHGGALH
jgi:hypothetical protein